MSNRIEILPDPETVFVDASAATPYLLPLVTVEDLHPSGPLHFVVPVDPYDGVVGEFTTPFHTATCRSNWLGFRYLDGLYQLDCDYQFFEKRFYENHPVPESIHPNVRDGWRDAVDDHYRKTLQAYASLRAAKDSGELDPADIGVEVRLGTRPIDANWSNMENFELEWLVDPSEEFAKNPYPLTEDGRRYDYIGSIEASNANMYDLLRCETLLFFDRVTSTSLLTFDWT